MNFGRFLEGRMYNKSTYVVVDPYYAVYSKKSKCTFQCFRDVSPIIIVRITVHAMHKILQ